MELIRKYPEGMDKRTAYKLMNGQSVFKISDAEGEELDVTAWVLFEDEDKTVLTILTGKDDMFGTISPTFIDSFIKMADFFGDDIGTIKVIGGESKAGKHFVTCDIV